MNAETDSLCKRDALLYSLGAVVSFHLAYSFKWTSFCMIIFLGCLFQLRRLPISRFSSYLGLVIGLAIYGVQLAFFTNIFGIAAFALWMVLAYWLRLFLWMLQRSEREFGSLKTAILAPFLWAGIEYFRSELYLLKFSWINVGYAFWESPQGMNLLYFGATGLSFILMTLAAGFCLRPKGIRVIFGAPLLFAVFMFTNLPTLSLSLRNDPANHVNVAGLHTDSASGKILAHELDGLLKEFPETQLAVLGEYTFYGPPPAEILEWCKRNEIYLIVGGTDPQNGEDYYNTAFVIDPNGEIVFKQAKSVPIQFFADGLPAESQKVWESPWGKIGIAICYDLSYSHIIDDLIRQGAQALVIPTLDELSWGEQEHRHHARVAPVRAAEYRIPIFRVGSNGISQLVDQNVKVLQTTEFPGHDATISGVLELQKKAKLPIDRWLFYPFVAVTVALAGYFGWTSFRRSLSKKAVISTIKNDH